MQNAIANRDTHSWPVAVYDAYPKHEGSRYQGKAFTKGDGYYHTIALRDTYGDTLPYTSDRWREVAAKLKVTVPFQTVISRDMGYSHCKSCGQKYAGTSPEGCQRIVRKANVQRANGYGQDWIVTERFYHYHKPGDVKTEACGGYMTWNLESEFLVQQKFFGLLFELEGITSTDTLSQFEDSFPSELIPLLRIGLVERRLMHFEARCTQAFMQISSKMSQAGQALQF